MKTVAKAIMTALLLVLSRPANIQGEALSIYEIQYTTDPGGASPLDGNIVDCLGGIVVCKPATGIPRLVIQDPNYPVGWGAIQVKDRYEIGVFTDVSAGDWISLTNMLVEENKGTTFLQYIEDNDPAFTIVSTGNPLPRPLTVSVGEIGAPAPGGWDGLEFTEWLVVDHSAEKYESMLIKVIDVNIGGRDYGKAYDNYVLQNNADPNSTCWASDYMNEDIDDIEGYHPYILTVPHFCSVAGLLEQYTGAKAGIDYDYYQLLTRSTADFVIEQTADFDGNCDVDFVDFGLFAQHWLETGCCEPDWCGGADFGGEGDGIVWMTDLAEFARYWLAGN